MSRAKIKLYACVLSLALVGFVVDRLIGEPRGVGAAEPGLSDPAGTGEKGPSSLSTQASIPEPFPANLRRLDWTGSVRDPFLLPAELIGSRGQRVLGNPDRQSDVAPRRRGEPLTVAQFTKLHRLTGVSVVGKSAMAIVDGRIVEIGQEVDHSRLLTVEGNRAYFRCLDGAAVLSVDHLD